MKQYLDDAQVASLPVAENINDTRDLDKTHPFLQGWISLIKSLADIQERREGIAVETLMEQIGPVQSMDMPSCDSQATAT
mmetsp:Transcript_2013/g.4200  ORF Transcript_2013/g.4200 Transcript_2013/m.4200 type:complete len:80 (-) Transcript_2013:26-265(-)